MGFFSKAWDAVSSPTGIATALGGAGAGLTANLLGLGGGGAPAAPDYTAAAQMQGQSGIANTQQQTWANRPDQTGPNGSISWESYDTGQKDALGNAITGWRQNTSLNPALDAANTAQQGLQQDRSQLAGGLWGQAAGELGQAPNFGGFQAVGGAVTPFSFQGAVGQTPLQSNLGLQTSYDFSNAGAMPDAQGMNQRGVDAVYDQAASRLDPQFARRQQSLETQLVNQGLKPGDAAYSAAMQDFNFARNDAYGSAQRNAITQGAQIGSQLFGQGLQTRQQGVGEAQAQGNFGNSALTQMGNFTNSAAQDQFGQNLAAGNFTNQAGAQQFGQNLAASQYDTQVRNAQIADAGTQQNWTLNNINNLLAGQQVSNPTFGSFSQAGAAAPTNYLGAAGMQGAYGLQSYGIDQQAQADQFGGLAQMGAAAIPFAFSDARLKTDIERHGVEVLPGVQLATWRWGDGTPDVGVIAQDVQDVRPDLVARHPSGYLMVNYSFPAEA